METTEKTIDVINDLVKINNDRVAGYEKAAKDIKEGNVGLRALFNKLVGESRENIAELMSYAGEYGADPTDETSIVDALHRAWVEIRAAFSGNDTVGILRECERGEDAIKKAYASALEHPGGISYDVVESIRRQQQGVMESHDLIRSLRDKSEEKKRSLEHNPNAEGSNNAKSIKPNTHNMRSEVDMKENELALAKEIPAGYADSNDVNDRRDFRSGTANVGEHQKTVVSRSPGADQEENKPINNYRGEKPAPKDSQLQEFFVNELKDLLWAERKLVDTLPKMEGAATSSELRNAFHTHLAQTEEHVQRLEQIFGTLGLDPDITKCEAMDGIVDEGEEIIDYTDEGTATRDVGLIFAGQKVEHYEIASYGGMISLANTLGYTEAVSMLTMTLIEEKAADALLTRIAENRLNYRAAY